MKNLYCIIGKSGSGKSTVVKHLCELLNANELLSYTTRKPRSTDENTHIFVDNYYPKENVVASTNFSGHEYWATKEQIEESDFYVVDIAGYRELLHKYKGEKRIVSIYIYASDKSLYYRMKARGDNEEKIKERIIHDKRVFDGNLIKHEMDYQIPNAVLQLTIDAITHIIEQEEGEEYGL